MLLVVVTTLLASTQQIVDATLRKVRRRRAHGFAARLTWITAPIMILRSDALETNASNRIRRILRDPILVALERVARCTLIATRRVVIRVVLVASRTCTHFRIRVFFQQMRIVVASEGNTRLTAAHTVVVVAARRTSTQLLRQKHVREV